MLVQEEPVGLEVVVRLDWPELYFNPINLWNVPQMTPTEIIEVTKLKTGCIQQCKLDVWRERCISCNRTITQIKEAYERSKTA